MPLSNNSIDDTNALIHVVTNLKRPQKFLLDTFFGQTVISDTEYVSIDVDVGKRRMAPFVSPLVEGKFVEARRIQTNTFKPPYIKEKRAPDLLRPVKRMIGERIGAPTMTPAQREDANIAFEMTDMIDAVDRRYEWMAAQALLTGTVTVRGEGFPTSLIDFGRDASLTLSLSTGAQWTQANIGTPNAPGPVSPSQNLQGWRRAMARQSGVVATDVICTDSAFAGLLLDPVLRGAILYPNQAPFGNRFNPGYATNVGAIHVGNWGGLDFWVYNDWYVDSSTNVELPYLPDGTLILTSPRMEGVRAYGQIIDPAFNYQSLMYAPKTELKFDPAQRIILMQSSGVVIPTRANASMAVTVVPPVYR